jgi:hypothetical protein
MTRRKLHDYFTRKHTTWNVRGFLDASELEPWDKKIEDYIINLEQIVKYEKNERRVKAQRLLDKYRKVSCLIFVVLGGQITAGLRDCCYLW